MNSGRQPSVGRPPGPHDDTLAKIMPIALRLFIDEGGGALTPTRLHQETGVSRATIYRNWPDPADLIEIMLARATEMPPDDCVTGDLIGDLHRAMDLLRFRFEHRPVRAFFAACLDYGRRSERVATAAEAFIGGILRPFHEIIEGAVAGGELDGPVERLVSELTGPLVLEHVVLGHHVGEERTRGLVERFVAANRSTS